MLLSTTVPFCRPLICLLIAGLFVTLGLAPVNRAVGETTIDPLKPHPAVAPALEQIDKAIAAGPFEANWRSLGGQQIPDWYRDAKLGIFIHWGAYSVPAFGSEWYPRKMYIDNSPNGADFFEHHKETYGPQKKFGYKDFLPRFKAEAFDADAWAELFEQAGARYVVPVAEHHDGFPMYDCSFTEWNATRMGPERDVIAELAKATRTRGLKFGVSSHRAFNWKFFVRRPEFDNADPEFARLYGRPMPFLFREDAFDYQKRFEPQDDQFKEDWLARSCELVDKYRPDLIWFDFGITASQQTHWSDNHYSPYLKRFAAYYYNKMSRGAAGEPTGENGVINYKWQAFPEEAAVLDLERSKMDAIRTPFWQTDTAVSASSWGYTENQKYKSPDRLIDDLVDIVSKNGCLLLNVGPRPDGTIPREDRDILLAIGGWLRQNGEAIYGARPWKTYGEGPTGTATGHLAESKDKPYTAKDIRFTTQGDTLYAIGLDWPPAPGDAGSKVTIKSLGEGSPTKLEEIDRITMLGTDGDLDWTRDAKGLTVSLPADKPNGFAYVLKIE